MYDLQECPISGVSELASVLTIEVFLYLIWELKVYNAHEFPSHYLIILVQNDDEFFYVKVFNKKTWNKPLIKNLFFIMRLLQKDNQVRKHWITFDVLPT